MSPKKPNSKNPTDPTVKASKLEVAAAKLQLRAAKARNSFADFLEFVWTDAKGSPLRLAPFQREWIAALEDDRKKRLFIESARNSGKSTIISIAWPVYLLGQDPNRRIKLLAQSDSRAKERLFEIRQNLESNRLLKLVFPELRIDLDAEESKSRLTVVRRSRAKDPSVEVCGVTSGGAGGRADFILLDDIVDMRNSILQPAMKEHVKQKVLGEWMPVLEPDGRFISISTPWSADDVLAYMKGSGEFFVISTPVGNDEDPLAPIWPERWPREKLEREFRILGSVEFDRAYRCKALSTDAVPIRPSWIKYYDTELLGDPWSLVCIQSYDLALSQDKKADYFAGVTLLYDSARNLIFVADAWKARLTLLEQATAISEMARAWTPGRIVIEKGGYQGALGQYLYAHAQTPLPVWPVSPRGNKAMRLFETTPLFESGRVLFNPRLDPTKNPSVAQRGDIIGELLQFPLSDRDDLVDALSQGINALREIFPSGERGNRDGFEDGDGISVRLTAI